ncbi:MAG: L,D-transpeptidase family protein [Aquificota bacterium]|nr:L,D-transpeptidase family protein [Aquificota bacterium]
MVSLKPDYNPSYFRFNDLIRRVRNPEVYRKKITAILRERFRTAPPVIVENPESKYVFLVEKMSQYLFVFRGKTLVGLYPVTTGEDWEDKWREGDRRTPEGIYYFTRFIPPDTLPKIYGGIAVVLNYPNPVDRLLKKGGGGIWLHGSEEGDRNRIPFSTRGCVVASNEDLKEITEKIKPGNTLIAIYKAVPEKINLDDVRGFIEEWRRSWERKDVERFLSFYSERFTWKGGGLREWRRYKRRVIVPRKFIRVSIDNMTILAFRRGLSDDVEYYVAEFFQSYRSDVYSDRGIKRLYIIKENGKLKILKEEFSEGG